MQRRRRRRRGKTNTHSMSNGEKGWTPKVQATVRKDGQP